MKLQKKTIFNFLYKFFTILWRICVKIWFIYIPNSSFFSSLSNFFIFVVVKISYSPNSLFFVVKIPYSPNSLLFCFNFVNFCKQLIYYNIFILRKRQIIFCLFICSIYIFLSINNFSIVSVFIEKFENP